MSLTNNETFEDVSDLEIAELYANSTPPRNYFDKKPYHIAKTSITDLRSDLEYMFDTLEMFETWDKYMEAECFMRLSKNTYYFLECQIRYYLEPIGRADFNLLEYYMVDEIIEELRGGNMASFVQIEIIKDK